MTDLMGEINASTAEQTTGIVQVNELMNQPILEREFGDWAMNFLLPGPDQFVELVAARWKGTAQSGPGATLLRSFWAGWRGDLS